MACRVSTSRRSIRTIAAVVAALSIASAAAADPVEGIWLSGDGDGWIEIRMLDDGPHGYIAGSPDDPDRLKPPRLDDKNPDPALRDRPLFGLEILYGFRAAGPNKWKGGRVYDPDSGKTYRGTLTLVDQDTLKLRGYVGISLLGRTDVWTRRVE